MTEVVQQEPEQEQEQSTGQYVSIGKLLEATVTQDDHHIPGKGKILIRSMTRKELFSLRNQARYKGKAKGASNSNNDDDIDKALYERLVIVNCVVSPEVDIKQALEWQNASGAGGEIDGVIKAIMQLSKLDDEAEKSDLLDDGDEL